MFNYHRPVPASLALALTLTSACHGESPLPTTPTPTTTADAGAGTATTRDNATGSTGGTPSIDAGLFDGSVSSSDAGSRDADASSGDGATDSVAVLGDAGAIDALDAAAPRDAGSDGAIVCDLNDRRFGCGTRRSVDFIHFASGLDIDTKSGRAWSAPIRANTFQAVRAACQVLVVNGLSNFEAPEVDDVRTLAAGCAATIPGGSCEVESGVVLPSESGACTCAPGVGPNDGKFCRPDVASCETLWTVTECGAASQECPTARSWFYDVRSGSLVLAGPEEPIAQQAQARCVAAITYIPL
jgi:hypothetical protein